MYSLLIFGRNKSAYNNKQMTINIIIIIKKITGNHLILYRLLVLGSNTRNNMQIIISITTLLRLVRILGRLLEGGVLVV